MAVYKVKKRNGTIVDFNKSKIENAIQKSIESVGGTDFSDIPTMTNKIMQIIEERTGKNVPEVEMIQDITEEILIKKWHDSIAKSYIIYRQKRNESRKNKSVMIDVANTMEEYLKNIDRRIKENSNIWYSIGGMILKNSEKITANYRLSHIYPEEIWNAHRNWDLHIHDLGMFTPYCAGRSLRALLEEWFNGVQDKIASHPPRHLNSAVNQMMNFFGTLSNERAWAQAFSSFDTYLAPFVHKYSELIIAELDELDVSFPSEEARQKYIDKKTYKYVIQCMQNFIFGMNTPSRRGCQTPFSNITLDRKCPRDMKDKALLLWGIEKWPYKKTYWDLEKEMRMINRALIKVYTDWDKNGRVFTFPIPTYNITEDFERDDPDITSLFEMTAKYGIPYFQNFIGSQFIVDEDGNRVRNDKAYKPDDVRSMCCRLQLDLNVLRKRGWGLFGSAEMTGSMWVVTLNLPRIWYKHKWNIEDMKKQIRYLMDTAKTSLEIKRTEMTKWHAADFYPYTKRYLPSFRNHFSTIGVNGMNELIINYSEGEYDLTSQKWRELALDLFDYMRDILTEYQEETGHLYNLEATPAEWCSYRFAREDKKHLPGIIQAGTDENPYYTNSSRLPAEFTEDIFEALDLQDDLQCKYTWGTVLHLYLWERIQDVEACKSLVKKVISNYRLPYVSITPTFSVCPEHGYIAGEHDFCPKCDQEIGYVEWKFDMKTRKWHTADSNKYHEYEKQKACCNHEPE